MKSHRLHHHPSIRAALASLAALALAGGLAACSGNTSGAGGDDKTVTLLVHDAFHVPDELKAAFEMDTGLTLKVVAGDSGQQLVSKLQLTKDHPVADAVYGFTGTTAGELAGTDVIADAGVAVPEGGEPYLLSEVPGAVPVDHGEVCANADPGYFAAHNQPLPETFDDLVKPEYRGLTVAPDPAGSDTGLAFLYATIAEKGADGWQDYWKKLLANDLKIVSGWSEAYEQEFTQGGGQGAYPIVLSYATSPAATVSEDGTSASSVNLPKTCFAQTEYAGVLQNAQNPEGAKKAIEWLTSVNVQKAIPDSMYMYPVRSDVELPDTWAKFAPKPPAADVLSLDPTLISKNREKWLREFEEIAGR